VTNLPVVVPPEFPLVDVSIDPNFAAISQFLGILDEAERRRAVKRSYSAWIPRELDTAIDRLVHDSRCGYEHDVGRFVLHAIWLLANAYKELGYPDALLGSELVHEHKVRSDAEQARKRSAYVDSIHQYDDELDLARRNGDWQSIDAHIAVVETYLQTAPTRTARERVLNATASSYSFRQAVLFVDQLSQVRKDVPKETSSRAARWRGYLEDLGLDKEHVRMVT